MTCQREIALPEDLPPEIRLLPFGTYKPRRERRRTVSDELYQKLVESGESFWTAVYPLYMNREITRGNLRDLVKKGLQEARGNYRIVVRLFNMDASRLQTLPQLPAHSRMPGVVQGVPVIRVLAGRRASGATA